MKKLVLIFVAISTLLISCDKEDNNNAKVSNLIGKWEVKSFLFDAKIDGKPVPDDEIAINGGVGNIFEFTTDKKVFITTYDQDEKAWTTEEGTYVYNSAESKLEITIFDSEDQTYDTQKVNILLLNSNQLNFGNYTKETLFGKVYEITTEFNCVRKK